jgi:outer membrane protein
MCRRPLIVALAFALLPSAAGAEDLMQTYHLARAGDPQFSAAESSRDIAKEGAVQASAALLPQIGLSASYGRSRSSGPSTQTQFDPATGQPIRVAGESESDTRNRSVGVDGTQVLFDFGALSRVRSQNALGRASDFTLEAAGDTLITRTSAAYFNVLIAAETLAAAQAQEAALKKQFDFADKRMEVGLAPITDVHEARAQYDSARANTIVTRNELEDAYQALAEITGTPVRNLKSLPDDFKPAMPDEQDADAWVSTALASNPSLQGLKEQVSSADADVNTARAGHMPTLYLNGSYGRSATWGDSTFTSTSFSSTLPASSESRGSSVGVTLSVPIFSGGATRSRVRQALAQRDVSVDEFEQHKRAVVRSTRNAYQSLLAGVSEVEARRLALVSARAAYEASQVGLEVGTRTVLDVLNNQNTLFNAQRDFARAKYNFLQSRLSLEQSAGTLDAADVKDVNRLLTVDA